MNEDIIEYLIENSTFIKNNLLNKVDNKLNVMMTVFIILNEEDLSKKRKICYLLEKYVDENIDVDTNNNEEDFLNVISTIIMFIRRVYSDDGEISKIIEHISSYQNYLVLSVKKYQLHIS